jgi:hypothetical protein
MNHTPGPWSYSKCPCGAEVCSQFTISVQWSVGFEEADARLIAAAPELLEVLRNLVTAVTFADPPKEFNGVLCHEARVPVGFVDAARAAIAKATGDAA